MLSYSHGPIGLPDGVIKISKRTAENLRESEPAFYDVELLQQPTDVVLVNISAGDSSVSVNQTLEFSPGSWDTPQAFEVLAIDDDIIQPSPYTASIHLATNSSDVNFKLASIVLPIRVDNLDAGTCPCS